MTDEPATGRPDAAAETVDVPLDLDTATRQALLTLPGRSPDAVVCPFLRAGTDRPPDPAAAEHRCVALAPALLIADRQRQLGCLRAAHASCPRYVRGEAAVRAGLAPGLGKRSRVAPVAIGSAAVLLVLVAAVAASSGVATPDGQLAGGGAGASQVVPGDSTAASPAVSAPSASGLPAPTLEPLATVRPTLVATRELPVAWRGLEACPAPDACYLYVVKRGDTFRAIAARFETTTRKLRKLNPTLGDPNTIRVGSIVRVPPPRP